MSPRWEGDERGAGTADAAAHAAGLRELLSAAEAPGWVAEHPEAHLLPHLARALASPQAELALVSSALGPDGELVVELRRRGEGDRREVRRAAFALVGTVAESATYVRERLGGDRVVLEVVTGMLAEDTDFDAHGHTLRLEVSLDPPAAREET